MMLDQVEATGEFVVALTLGWHLYAAQSVQRKAVHIK
jgi:hypothetical protein